MKKDGDEGSRQQEHKRRRKRIHESRELNEGEKLQREYHLQVSSLKVDEVSHVEPVLPSQRFCHYTNFVGKSVSLASLVAAREVL